MAVVFLFLKPLSLVEISISIKVLNMRSVPAASFSRFFHRSGSLATFLVAASLCVLAIQSLTWGQEAAADRIPGVLDSSRMVELKNHVSPLARPQFDQGPVETSRMMHVSMLFLPSAEQEKALTALIGEQQDKKSPHYHQWLTVSQYADRFGLCPSDIGKVKAWLVAQGFKITYVANGRDSISFQGTAGQVQSVFHTQVHNYNVKGKMHFANVTPPMIPAALSGIVGGFRGLHNFFPHSMQRQRPSYTFTDGGNTYHALAPGDLATIYNITPLYNESINGAGVNVVIAGQSDVYLADINYFRGAFGLTQLSGCTVTSGVIQAGNCTAGNFQQVWPEGNDPEVVPGDLSESDLDIETLSGVAPGAKIVFVTSGNGVDDSVAYAVDQDPPLGTVISYSDGACEALVSGAGAIATSESVYEKAVSEGISMFAASGDTAAAICDDAVGTGEEPALYGQSVSYPASSAYVTGVGGTEFDEGSGTYWGSASENGTSGGSALSYIPESAWNDTAQYTDGNTFVLDGSGGGPSNCAYESSSTTVDDYAFAICKASPNGGFSKPWWQGSVTPSDGVRDVPDIAFSGSNFNDPYIVCTPLSELGDGNESTSSCSPGGTTGINNALTLTPYPSAFGGTSAPTPVTAGMAALLNQYLAANGLGLINPQLYALFSANPSGVFNDIDAGTNSITGGASSNVVTCTDGTPNFETSTTMVCPSTGEIGFTVSGGPTYSEVTGVGSVNIDAFVRAWATEEFVLTTSSSSLTVGQGQSQQITINTTTFAGFSGTIGNFSCSGLPAGATCSFNPTSVTAGSPTTLTITTTALGQAMRKGSPQKRKLGWLGGAVLPVFGICLIGFATRGRRRAIFAALTVLALLSALLSCGGSGGSTTTSNPVPSISSLSPTQEPAGSQSQTLTINGSNFMSGSTVTYNSVSHAATFLSASQLTTNLSANDLATAGSYPVVVTNPTPGGGPSNAVNFTVTAPNPVPSITSLSPTQQAAGSQAQTLTINGTSFIAGSTVTYNGVAHEAGYVSATQLTTTLSASDLLTMGQYPVVVTNPAPGGGSSSAVDFNVVSGTPAGNFTVTVSGTSGSVTQQTTFTLTVQ
jgi:hypothetical protein